MSKNCCEPEKEKPFESMSSIDGEIKISSFKVGGMDCADEVNAIKKALSIPLVSKVDANIIAESVTVHHAKSLSQDQIENLIKGTGVKIIGNATQTFYQGHAQRIFLIGGSGVSLAAGMVLDWMEVSNTFMIGLYFISILMAGFIIFPKAYRSLKTFSLDMNVLMTIAVFGAIAIKEYSEAATVIFLFALAEMLEAMSVARARKAIKEVLSITPTKVLVETADGKNETREVESVQVSEIIIVRAGESIALDGIVIDGESSVNQASLTGESMPVAKKKGENVLAGTLNELGVLKIEVTAGFKDTKVSKIITLIEEAQAQKAPSQRFVDSFARIYTPIILLVAILVAILPPLLTGEPSETWIYRALVLLVIGCPCALVIATPVSVVSGLTSLARLGVLVKGGAFLEALGRLKAVALDKTGTITEGKPKVQGCRLFSTKLNEDEMLRVTASLESISTHPLAHAIMAYAADKKITGISHPKNFKLINGRGATASLDGHEYFVGNHALAHELGVCNEEIEKHLESIESKALSVIIVGHAPHDGCAGEVLAVFEVGDAIKTNAREAIEGLHAAGISTVIMISGDNQKTVNEVSRRVGIDVAKGDLLPDDKVQEIKGLVKKYRFVGMVGDGVNDAPALAHATVGIAMGAAGTSTAIETADIALMRDDLIELPKAILQGKRVLNIIRFNIGFALAIKVVFLVLAFAGKSTLWMAVAADAGASVFVTFNALRLLKVSKP